MAEPSRPATVRAFAMLLPLLLALAGCAGIPTSGPVRPGGQQQLDPENEGVPFIAEPPRRGAPPGDVVRGFLRAGADFRNDHAVAREYLTPAARQKWEPDTGTVVYGTSTVPDEVQGDTIVVRVPEVARIDSEGSYRRTPAGTVVERTFGLQRVDGEWRIAQLDDGLLLPLIDVTQTYRQVALYFLSPTRNTLVADPVLLPQLPGLSTQVVSRLLRGPTAGLRGAVRTAVPPGTELEVGSVPVSDGLATVRLDETALRADEQARQQMSAQIVWTLKQLGPEIARIRITAGGEDLVTSGVSAEQPRDSWATFDPDALPADPSVYLVRDGAVARLVEGRVEPVTGPASRPAARLRTPAVSLDEAHLAAVGQDGRTLVTGRLAAASDLTAVATGEDLAAPSWDPSANLWFLDRATGSLRVLVTGRTEPLPVAVPRLPGGRPSAVAVSRDGVRIALVSGTGSQARLWVGSLAGLETVDGESGRAGRLAVTGLYEVLPDLRGVRDVAWADAAALVALGSLSGLPARPHVVTVDGYDVVDVEPQEGLVSVTAAPPRGRPLVGATAGGDLTQFTSGGWAVLGQGTDRAYPG